MEQRASEAEFEAFLREELPHDQFAALRAAWPQDLRARFYFWDTLMVTYGFMEDEWVAHLTEVQRQAFESASDLLERCRDGRILNAIRMFCCH